MQPVEAAGVGNAGDEKSEKGDKAQQTQGDGRPDLLPQRRPVAAKQVVTGHAEQQVEQRGLGTDQGPCAVHTDEGNGSKGDREQRHQRDQRLYAGSPKHGERAEAAREREADKREFGDDNRPGIVPHRSPAILVIPAAKGINDGKNSDESQQGDRHGKGRRRTGFCRCGCALHEASPSDRG